MPFMESYKDDNDMRNLEVVMNLVVNLFSHQRIRFFTLTDTKSVHRKTFSAFRSDFLD